MSLTLIRAVATVALAFGTLLGGASVAMAQALDDGAEILGENVLLACSQPSVTALECDFRLVNPAPVRSVQAHLGELELPAPEIFAYPQPGAVSAVLFLIDTSDPRRAAAVAASVQHVRRLLRSAGDHHLFGLATFDSKLNVLVRPGATAASIEAALGEVRAQGRTTELYRNTLAAVNLVGSYPAARRTVMIFSDGQAEDKAYFHADVVAAARKLGVSIDGLGYPRSVALSVHLQTLRRMADETGGRFAEGSPAFVLPEGFLAAPFASLDSGGTLTLDLTSAVEAGATGSGVVNLDIRLDTGRASARVNVRMPEPPPPEPVVVQVVAPPPVVASPPLPTPAPEPVASAPTAPASGASSTASAVGGTSGADTVVAGSGPTSGAGPTGSGVNPAQGGSGQEAGSGTGASTPAATPPAVRSETPFTAPALVPVQSSPIQVPGLGITMTLTDVLTWAIVVAGVLMIILLVVLVRVVRQRRAAHQPPVAAAGKAGAGEPANDDAGQVFAFLDAMDGSGDRYPITSAAFRIGRHADNELPIADASMSRHHAQIQMKRDGSFTVTDLESMNGVFVNEKRVTSAPVKDGDLVELGDVRMRFGVTRHDALGGDETVMVRTALPDEMGNRGAA